MTPTQVIMQFDMAQCLLQIAASSALESGITPESLILAGLEDEGLRSMYQKIYDTWQGSKVTAEAVK